MLLAIGFVIGSVVTFLAVVAYALVDDDREGIRSGM